MAGFFNDYCQIFIIVYQSWIFEGSSKNMIFRCCKIRILIKYLNISYVLISLFMVCLGKELIWKICK